MRVRCAGYRHSWAPIFGQDQQILVSFVNLHTVTTIPDPITIAESLGNPKAELKTIELKEEVSQGHRLCRLGAAVTSEDFRRWQLENSWVLAVDTVLVEVTIGGITQGLCHGAGIAHKAIPDYVRCIEYVDCNGVVQKVDDLVQLKVAAGNFGLVRALIMINRC